MHEASFRRSMILDLQKSDKFSISLIMELSQGCFVFPMHVMGSRVGVGIGVLVGGRFVGEGTDTVGAPGLGVLVGNPGAVVGVMVEGVGEI